MRPPAQAIRVAPAISVVRSPLTTDDGVVMTAGTGSRGLPLLTVQNISGQSFLTLEFVRRKAANNSGVSYLVEFTNDLTNAASWSAVGIEAPPTPIDVVSERVKVTEPLPISPTRFARLRIQY